MLLIFGSMDSIAFPQAARIVAVRLNPGVMFMHETNKDEKFFMKFIFWACVHGDSLQYLQKENQLIL